MKLSQTAAYGLHATLQLAKLQSTSPVSCNKIAAEGELPERFLLQILRGLVKKGILKSTRGIEGGYELSRSPDEVSVLEVIEAIDGPVNSKMPISEGLPDTFQEKMRVALEQVAQASRQQLEAIKLSHLL